MKTNEAHRTEAKKNAENRITKVTVTDKKAIAQANVVAAKNAIAKYRKQATNH